MLTLHNRLLRLDPRWTTARWGRATPIDDSGKRFRLKAKARLIEVIRDALGEAEAYVDGKCSVECVRDALRKEAEHLTEVGWYTRAQHFFNAADALDALNKDDVQ